ncbi:MAG: sigma-70 family RNA polymerase sigma factor [Bacteroidales bacterium]|nr:sigma-70 family RNA polymerase sigma factor [Bacteroidales bacterium]
MDKTKFWSRKYEGNIDRLVAICYRYVGERQTAEDLAHEAFLKAIERADTCRVMDSFDTWLTRITVNRCISYLRTRPETVPLEEELTADQPDSEEEFVEQPDFTKEELLVTIQQLSERQRIVFNLHALDRVPHQRIADLLDISVTNSKQLFLRARLRLQQLLADKAQEKESKKKGLLMIALLFMMKRNSAHHLDRLYRSELSQLRMSPAHRLSESEIRSAVAASPVSAGIALATHKTAALIAAAATVAGGVCMWQMVRNTPNENAIPPGETCHGASLQPEELEPTPISDTKVAETVTSKPAETVTASVETRHGTSLQPEPVVITREIPVTRTVVLHDTITVTDTVFLMQTHD